MSVLRSVIASASLVTCLFLTLSCQQITELVGKQELGSSVSPDSHQVIPESEKRIGPSIPPLVPDQRIRPSILPSFLRPADTRVDFNGASMPFNFGRNSKVPMKGRRYQVYAGLGTTSFRLQIETKMAANDPKNGIYVWLPTQMNSGGRPLAQVTAGSQEIQVPGNVAIVELQWDGQGEFLRDGNNLKILSVDKRLSTSPLTPSPVLTLADQVASMPLKLHEPVDLFAPPANPANPVDTGIYYLTVPNVRGKNLNVVMDGEGEILISTLDKGFVTPNATEPPLGRVRNSDGNIRFLENVAADTLLLTVVMSSKSEALHSRVSVNEVNARYPLTIRMNGVPTDFGVSNRQELVDKLTAKVESASRLLYQASTGRFYIDRLKILIGQTAEPLAKIDTRVDPFKYVDRSHVRFGIGFIPDIMELDRDWWDNRTETAGRTLSHEFMHLNFHILDEYLEKYNFLIIPSGNTTSKCPNSLMSIALQEFCWKGNHNLEHDSEIAKRFTDPPNSTREEDKDLSVWEILARRFNFTPPDHQPPLVLKDMDPWQEMVKTKVRLSIQVETVEVPAPTISLPPVVIPSATLPCFIPGIGGC